MFSTKAILTFSLALAASAHPLHAPRQHHAIAARFTEPEGWFHDYLEPYDNYHVRYLALKCHEQHDTEFFDLCCHPMLATETLENNRAPECRPSPDASASASAAAPTSTVDDSDGLEDCEEYEEDDAADETTTTAEAAQATPAPEDSSSSEEGSSETTSSSSSSSTEESKPTTTTTSAEPENTDNGNGQGSDSGSGGQTFTGGQVTYYFQNGVAGACGVVHSDEDLIAAMNTEQYYSLDICNKRVKITSDEGKTVTVKVVDQCPSCGVNDIDLSRAAFRALAPYSQGIAKVSWELLD